MPVSGILFKSVYYAVKAGQFIQFGYIVPSIIRKPGFLNLILKKITSIIIIIYLHTGYPFGFLYPKPHRLLEGNYIHVLQFFHNLPKF